MKKLVLILVLLSISARAATNTHRQVLANTACTSAGANCTTAGFTPGAGELLVAFVTASATVDTAPKLVDSQGLGMALIGSATYATSVNTIYLFVSTGFAAASSTTMVATFPNDASTGVIIFVVGVSGMTRFGGQAVRQWAAQSNRATTTTPGPAFAVAALTGNPVLGVVGNNTSPAGMTPPTGFTENASGDTGYSTPTTGAEYVMRDSGFTGTTVTWGNNSASVNGSLIVELDTSAAPSTYVWPSCDSSHPCVIQSNQSVGAGSDALSAVKISFPNVTLSGNTLQLGATFMAGRTISSVTDDIGNTWVQRTTCAGTDLRTDIWSVINSTAGVVKVTVNFSGALAADFIAQLTITEVYGLTAIDGTSTCTANVSPPAPQPGSITTTQANDFVYNYAFQNYAFPTSEGNLGGLSADRDSTLLGVDMNYKGGHQFQVQTASGAINPTFYSADPNGHTWNSAAVAYKFNTIGTLPSSGIRIVKVLHLLPLGVAPDTKIQFPTSGNLFVLSTTNNTTSYAVTSPSDTQSNTWTKVSTSTAQFPQIWYAVNATPSVNGIWTWTQANSATHYIAYDITGANTSPFDLKAENSGSQGAANQNITGAASITPTTSNGLIISLLEFGTGPPSGAVTSGMIMDSLWGTGMSDTSNYDTGDGWAHIYNSGTSAYSFDWTVANGVASSWDALAVAFKAPAAVGGTKLCTMTLLGAGPC